jgi:SpoVK/Ycf46/Vps4 family AAA+-type ATPase
MTACKKCSVDNRKEAKYCRKCGTKLVSVTENILQDVIGKTDIMNQIAERVNMYNEEKKRANPRSNMNILVLGSAGSGKTFIADTIQNYYFANGVITQPELKRIDASNFEGLTDEDVEKYRNSILFIDNVHLLMNNPDSISPIDSLLSRMEDFEREEKRDIKKSYTNPIVIFAGLTSIVESYFEKKSSGMSRFGLNITLKDYSVEDLYHLCSLELTKKKLNVTPETEKKLYGYFKALIRQRKITFRNAYEAVEKSNQIQQQMYKNNHKEVEEDDITGDIYYEPTPEEIMQNLENFVGIANIKKEVRSLIDSVEECRRKSGDPKSVPNFGDHFIFTGNPGTGKTTIARVFADILSSLGILPNGQLIEVTRDELVGQYIGATAARTRSVVESAMGGVLFIDEAYTLATGGESDFGREAINTLLKPVEEQRGKFVCIIAGYSKEMMEFVNANSGIASRFNKKIEFEDYQPEELTQIFRNLLDKGEEKFTLDTDADDCLLKFFEKMYATRTKNFGNAREVVNAFRKAKERHAQRLRNEEKQEDHTLTRSDIEGEEALKVLSIEDIVAQIDKEFIGMEAIKNFVREIAIQKADMDDRLNLGLPVDQTIKLNIILTGNPGTGKTSVARKLGEIFYAMKLLSSPEVIERERKDIVGKYVNSAGEEMGRACDLAMGKLLFIDEAYALAPMNDAGIKDEEATKAVEVLMKRMEDDAGKFAVILAGYPRKMDDFMRVNEGIARRITYRLNIDDYSQTELTGIFKNIARKKGYQLSQDTESQLANKIADMLSRKDSSWGNAGEMVKLFSMVKGKLATRLRTLPKEELTKESYTTIMPEDIPFDHQKKLDPEEALAKLDKLVGLQNIKDQLRSLIASFKIDEQKAKLTGKIVKRSAPHYIFMGNPGTGKTTVAKMMADILVSIGVLTRNNPVEVTEKDLVAGVVGQTAIKTTNVINSAMGGVLFIDEAYSLNKEEGSNSFGMEAINTLLERLTRDAGKFVCVLAGYKREMKSFLETNSGLSRRFRIIEFEDYKPEELELIFRNLLKKDGMQMDEYAEKNLSIFFRKVYETRDINSFGNAGAVVNIFNVAKERQGKRLIPLLTEGKCTEQDQCTMTYTDITGEQAMSKSSAELMDEFNHFIGGKKAIESMANVLKQIEFERKRAKITNRPFTNKKNRFAFIGNSDTGQKEFVGIMSKIYKEIAIVEDAEIHDIDLSLTARSIIYQQDSDDSTFSDAIGSFAVIHNTQALLEPQYAKQMENYLYHKMETDVKGTIFILIFTELEWQKFISLCPRLTIMLRDTFVFDNYSEEDLSQLFINYAEENGMKLTEEAKLLLPTYFSTHREFGKTEIKTLMNDTINNLDARLDARSKLNEVISDKDLTLITPEDIPLRQNNSFENNIHSFN